MGREVADAAAPWGDRVPRPAIGIHVRPAAHALVDELEDRLVVQLVVPALETLGTDDLVPAVLHLLALRRRANDAHAQLGGPQTVAVAGVVAEAGHERRGIRAVVLDQVRERVVGRRVDRRSEEHKSELKSLRRISYAAFCLQKKKNPIT